jgi:formylglycine-generating enzyme required for sulfatase activity
MRKIFLPLLFAIACPAWLAANNIQVANPGISGQNTTSKFSLVGFDVSWENSWRLANNENNWDAAWVFVKFRKKGATGWQHATLSSSGHTAGAGASITTSPDGKGIFIYRNAAGAGNVNFTGNKLQWNYGTDGVLDSDSVEVHVFATEMVYVTPGGYWLGSNGTEVSHFRRGDKDTTFWVANENAISIGSTSSNITAAAGAFSGSVANIPAAYPKGTNAFYCMKYEVSEQQYVDFLNNLDQERAAIRNPGYSGPHPAITAAFPERAAQNVSMADAAAFLDWSALRPMTELEYEKACRGFNISPVPNEFAFGNTSFTNPSGIVNGGTTTETLTTGNLNYASLINRPLRCGVFATASSTRVSSGGTYYGIMEMSGNVFEWLISAASTSGLSFTGLHGDGNIGANAETDITVAVNGNTAWGFRGGSYTQALDQCRVSDRYYGNYGTSYGYTSRNVSHGMRGVRTAQ